MTDNKELNFFKRAASLSDVTHNPVLEPTVVSRKEKDDKTLSESDNETSASRPKKLSGESSFKENLTPISDTQTVFHSPQRRILKRNDQQLKKIASDAIEALEKASFSGYAKEINGIMSEKAKQKFTVAVVGEFSRGKSTFINKLLERDILPVANMPTTAMLTRIRYSNRDESIKIYDTKKKTKTSLPLTSESWQNYIADDNGNDPEGVAFVRMNSPWLKKGIEIIDTPGAGDLEEKRAGIIEDALKTSDCAIITISALSALSMSEKLFIQERLIAKKTPFLMLIITKLDQVDKNQRNDVVRYIKEKLKLWKFSDICVYIPYKVEMPDDTFDSIIGMDKIKSRINLWLSGSDRKALAEQWTALKLKSHFQAIINHAIEQKGIFDESDAKKKQLLIEKKRQMLDKADDVWCSIKTQMKQKEEDCYQAFLTKVSDFKEFLVEKLQYEVSHTSSVKKWWEDDFPYKMKIEMSNLSNSIEVLVSRYVTKDMTWFNTVLEKNFKTSVIFTPEDVADKAHYTNFDLDDSIKIEDLSKSRNISRIGLTALSLGAAMACTAVGIAPLFATMGLGTGGSILSETVFKSKAETQKKKIKDELQTRVPLIINNATTYSESRIKSIYQSILDEAVKKQESWIGAQKEVIDSALSDSQGENNFDADYVIETMKSLCFKIDKYLSC